MSDVVETKIGPPHTERAQPELRQIVCYAMLTSSLHYSTAVFLSAINNCVQSRRGQHSVLCLLIVKQVVTSKINGYVLACFELINNATPVARQLFKDRLEGRISLRKVLSPV